MIILKNRGFSELPKSFGGKILTTVDSKVFPTITIFYRAHEIMTPKFRTPCKIPHLDRIMVCGAHASNGFPCWCKNGETNVGTRSAEWRRTGLLMFFCRVLARPKERPYLKMIIFFVRMPSFFFFSGVFRMEFYVKGTGSQN